MADITQSDPILQEFWAKLQPWYAAKYPGRSLILTYVRRTPVEQLRLFCQGRLPEISGEIVTGLDGFIKMSKHNFNPSRAIDVAILVSGKADWSRSAAVTLAPAVRELGYIGRIEWGGSWVSLEDWYHFQV
jgi:hypothetical protein